jgi:hypothetical protein
LPAARPRLRLRVPWLRPVRRRPRLEQWSARLQRRSVLAQRRLEQSLAPREPRWALRELW